MQPDGPEILAEVGLEAPAVGGFERMAGGAQGALDRG
jgi:hypothetical protein